MSANFYEALASAVYLVKTLLPNMKDDEQRIKASGLYDEWGKGKHEAGEIYNADGQTWECFQSYDNAIYPDIVPEGSAWHTFNRPLHGKSRATARPWVRPMGAHDIYQVGEFMVWVDNTVYQCIAATNFGPEEYAEAWKEVE